MTLQCLILHGTPEAWRPQAPRVGGIDVAGSPAASLSVFLTNDIAGARSIAPAKIDPFPDWSEDSIRLYLAAAVRLSTMVQRRLNRLHSANGPETMWNVDDSPEQYWFGPYSSNKMGKLWSTFNSIVRRLGSKQLHIVCNSSKRFYGMASPGISRITLGSVWDSPNQGTEDDAERVQTFIHEAAHISGRGVLNEGKLYGREAAHGLTSSHRMKATRNADNYGYYALDILVNASNLGG